MRQELLTAGQKNVALEGLRGVACLSVFLCHFLFSFFPYLTSTFNRGSDLPRAYAWETVAKLPVATVFFNGNFGVAIFFVLSGYVLTNRYFVSNDPSALNYGAGKRYLRLGLPVVASILLAWAVFSLGWMFNQKAPEIGSAGWPMVFYKDPVSFWQALLDGLYGAAVFGRAELNSPLWTIQIELIGSLLLYATYSFFGFRYPVVNLLFFFGAAQLLFPKSPSQIHCLTIFAGSLLNYIHFDQGRVRRLTSVFVFAGCVLGAYDYSPWFDWLRLLPLPAIGGTVVDFQTYDRYAFNAIGAMLLVAGLLGSVRMRAVFSWVSANFYAPSEAQCCQA